MLVTGRQGPHWLLRAQAFSHSAARDHFTVHNQRKLRLPCSHYTSSRTCRSCGAIFSQQIQRSCGAIFAQQIQRPKVYQFHGSNALTRQSGTSTNNGGNLTLRGVYDRAKVRKLGDSRRGIAPARVSNSKCIMQDAVQSPLTKDMGSDMQSLDAREPVERIASVGGYNTEFLELRADKPSLHVIVIPGNPGISAYYGTFVASLFKRLHGQATVTAIGYAGFTQKGGEGWRTFSLQDQIEHKEAFVEQVCRSSNIPIVLIGHSIGAFVSLDLLRRFPDRVSQVVGLYPFLTVNHDSPNQRFLSKLTHVLPLCVFLSFILATLGALPFRLGPAILGRLLKRTWEPSVAEITTRYMLQYHVARNVMHLGKTEFDTLWHLPDWDFLRTNQRKVALIFGSNDHWGPLSLLNEVNKQAPLLRTIVEREGHLHAFCCTSKGSKWVAAESAKLVQESILASKL